ncbi:PAS domain S-box protein [Natribaculum luteum]|uniref:histidine kinase n=1 Tax=Natribaculum luteum TaxID=1586232 RepID=A0ABD5NXC8_9EURY|nr:PAS domain S-box protein [Natribaculum luteum]
MEIDVSTRAETVACVGLERTDDVLSFEHTTDRTWHVERVAPDAIGSRVDDGVGCVVVGDSTGKTDPVEILEAVRIRSSHVQTVFWTGTDDEIAIGRAIDAGVDDVVHRDTPGSQRVLTNAIDGALESRATRREAVRYRSIVERSPDTIAVHDVDGDVVAVNEQACRSLGYSRAELLAGSIYDVEVGLDEAELEDVWSGEFDHPTRLTGRHRRADGTEFPVEIHLDRISFDGEERIVAIARDVTERRERERDLRRLSAAVDASMDGIAVCDDDGRYVYLNQAHAECYGYDSPEPLLGERWSALYDDDERERFETEILPELADRGNWRGEAVGRRRDGTTFDQALSLAALDGGGSVCVIRDVTRRKDRIRRIRALERKYRTLIDAAPDPIVVANADSGEIVEVNEAAEDLFGRSREEIVGTPQTAIHPADERERYVEGFSAATDGIHRFRATDDRQLHVIDADDQTIPVEISRASVRLEGATVVHGIFRDIRERLERERQLESLNAAVRALLEATTVGEIETIVRQTASAVCDGRPDVDVEVVETSRDVPSPADDVAVQSGLARDDRSVSENETVAVETATSDGSAVVVAFDSQERLDAAGRELAELLAGAAASAVDRVSREQRLEGQTEALSVLNQVLRHDVRNDMNMVYGWADLLLEDATGDARSRLETIQSSAQHTIDLTNDARHLANAIVEDEPRELRPVAPSRFLESEIEKLRTHHEDVIVDIDGSIPDVRVEADGMLSSVFGNVLNNAVRHNDTDRPEVTVRATADEMTLVVHIADDGPGIPDHLKAVVFERGVKGLESPGTGLGLFLVNALVDGYGGEVWIEDREPRGTIVAIELPLV